MILFGKSGHFDAVGVIPFSDTDQLIATFKGAALIKEDI